MVDGELVTIATPDDVALHSGITDLAKPLLEGAGSRRPTAPPFIEAGKTSAISTLRPGNRDARLHRPSLRPAGNLGNVDVANRIATSNGVALH